MFSVRVEAHRRCKVLGCSTSTRAKAKVIGNVPALRYDQECDDELSISVR